MTPTHGRYPYSFGQGLGAELAPAGRIAAHAAQLPEGTVP